MTRLPLIAFAFVLVAAATEVPVNNANQTAILFERAFFQPIFDPELPQLIRSLIVRLQQQPDHRLPLERITVELVLGLYDRILDHEPDSAVSVLHDLRDVLGVDDAFDTVLLYAERAAAGRFVPDPALPIEIDLPAGASLDFLSLSTLERCPAWVRRPAALRALLRCGLRFPIGDYLSLVGTATAEVVPLLDGRWLGALLTESLTKDILGALLRVEPLLCDHIRRHPKRFLTDVVLAKDAGFLQAAIEAAPDLITEIVNRRCFEGGESVLHAICRQDLMIQLMALLLSVPGVELTLENAAGLIPFQLAPSIPGVAAVLMASPSLNAFVAGPKFRALIEENDRMAIELVRLNPALASLPESAPL